MGHYSDLILNLIWKSDSDILKILFFAHFIQLLLLNSSRCRYIIAYNSINIVYINKKLATRPRIWTSNLLKESIENSKIKILLKRNFPLVDTFESHF